LSAILAADRWTADAKRNLVSTEVQRAFSENSKAAFTVLNNTGHATEAFPADIDCLKGVKYNSEEIYKAIREGLDHAYRQGKISLDLYEASCGDT